MSARALSVHLSACFSICLHKRSYLIRLQMHAGQHGCTYILTSVICKNVRTHPTTSFVWVCMLFDMFVPTLLFCLNQHAVHVPALLLHLSAYECFQHVCTCPATSFSGTVLTCLHPPCHFFHSSADCWHVCICTFRASYFIVPLQTCLRLPCYFLRLHLHAVYYDCTCPVNLFACICVNVCIYFSHLLSASACSYLPVQVFFLANLRLLLPGYKKNPINPEIQRPEPGSGSWDLFLCL
jgi:hypothetical protein